MGRVSLTEAYDDRSVIAKLNEMDKRVTENTTVVTSAEASAKASAQAAQETADRFAGSVGAVVQNANAQINASKAQVDQAKAEVDETVTTVAQAVQTANNASASAQQSATTVEGYDARLTATESKNSQQDTAIDALQTEDANNVKISGTHAIGNYAILLVDNQTKNGILTMNTGMNGIKYPVCDKTPENVDNMYIRLFSIAKRSSMLMFTVKTPVQYMTVLADLRPSMVTVRTEIHGTKADRFANTDIIVMSDDTKYYFFMKYPQNRKFVLDFENANPLFKNGTDAFVGVDTRFFNRVLVNEPEIGDVYTGKYVSEAM